MEDVKTAKSEMREISYKKLLEIAFSTYVPDRYASYFQKFLKDTLLMAKKVGCKIEEFYFKQDIVSGELKTMERVICIDNKPKEGIFFTEEEYRALGLLKIGCIYTVEKEYVYPEGRIAYDLKEIKCDTMNFGAKSFISEAVMYESEKVIVKKPKYQKMDNQSNIKTVQDIQAKSTKARSLNYGKIKKKYRQK